VVAGVIGKRKFAFDLWGDTVNTASRMESHGQPGRVHVSQATHDLLSEQFTFEARGLTQIKGKGELSTFFLNER
jgi:class 3 adenylate cyclase